MIHALSRVNDKVEGAVKTIFNGPIKEIGKQVVSKEVRTVNLTVF